MFLRSQCLLDARFGRRSQIKSLVVASCSCSLDFHTGANGRCRMVALQKPYCCVRERECGPCRQAYRTDRNFCALAAALRWLDWTSNVVFMIVSLVMLSAMARAAAYMSPAEEKRPGSHGTVKPK